MVWSVLLRLSILLFLLKIVWNCCVAYHLVRLARERSEAGVSMFTLIEVCLLIVAMAFAALANEDEVTPARVAFYGAIAIAFSYAHLFVVGFVWGLRRWYSLRRKGGPPPPHK